MNYALIENGIIENIIHLHPMNAVDFPNAVPLNDIPAGIGDTYDGTHFYRDGERLLSAQEDAKNQLDEARAEIELLDAALLDAVYENILGGIEE